MAERSRPEPRQTMAGTPGARGAGTRETSGPAERPRRSEAHEIVVAPHDSVFFRLLAVILAMAGMVMVLVVSFFVVTVFPSLHVSLNRMFQQVAHAIAVTEPDLATARRLSGALGVEIRYQGPDTAWSTAAGLPTFEAVRARTRPGDVRLHRAHLATTAGGGSYLFVRSFAGQFHAMYTNLLALLLVLLTLVFALTYVMLRRTLRPLRALNDGVARLGAGQLDVEVPSSTRDEFGALTRAFNRMARRVRDMLGARDQLLRDVSHELRSPLTRMKVALAMLPEHSSKASMEADVAEMERMVAELLEMERLREGRGVLRERRDVAGILREVGAEFAGRPPGVRMGSVSEGLFADVDRDQVRTVLRNLLENALKYSLPSSGPVLLAAGKEDDRVVVRVTDDGPGIPADQRERLFEPFFRIDPSRSKQTGGYGLGLSICKRIMEAHGGSIAVEAGEGRGATFVLVFPGAEA